jgi:hypothetical protein
MRTERAGKVVDAAISYLKELLRAIKLEATGNSGIRKRAVRRQISKNADYLTEWCTGTWVNCSESG